VKTDLDVAGTGSMVADEIQRVPRILGADEKLLLASGGEAGALVRRVGGVTLNHLGWARVLGLRAGIFGKQSDDAAGRFLRAAMDRLGIERQIDLDGSASSRAQIFVDDHGGRAIYMARGATGELTPAEIDARHRPMIARARWLTTEVSQLPLATVLRVLELGRGYGARTVLDVDVPLADAVPALGTQAQLHAALGLADVIKPSRAALAGLIDGDDPAQLARAVAQKFGARVVALTAGEAGSVVWADEQLVRAPAARVRALDTTGAGDAFLGGLLAGMVRGLDWEAAARLGNACGAACCERLGAFPEDPVRDRERALELYRELGGGTLDWEFPADLAASRSELEEFLGIASDEVASAAARFDRRSCAAAAELILAAEAAGGRVHVTGIGKPEHLARYAASLLSSTGTPATFLHGTEATHGSIGQLRPGDVLIAISNSGTTRELLDTVAAARSAGARIIAVTGNPESPLAAGADARLEARARREGGPLDLAPRASMLVQTLVLAALSVELQSRRAFTRADYHARHPAGALGRRSGSD
jgi:arabinose-5-phosphate isomerase